MDETSLSERGKNGRFLSGNCGGPGRPTRQAEQAYLTATFANCQPEDWSDIVVKAVEQAKGGSHSAREWLSKYLLPAQSIFAAQVINMDLSTPLGTTEELQAAVMKRIEELVDDGFQGKG